VSRLGDRRTTLRPALEGAGPEQGQQRKMRASVLTSLLAGARRVTVQSAVTSGFVSVDSLNRTPQPVRRNVSQATNIRNDPNGRGHPTGHLPPRVAPASWDGEPGYTQPVQP
jgi:hypothetical protein